MILNKPQFYVPRIEISTDVEAFISRPGHVEVVHPGPPVQRIAVPNWLIEWSKSRNLFLSMATDPWVLRPN